MSNKMKVFDSRQEGLIDTTIRVTIYKGHRLKD